MFLFLFNFWPHFQASACATTHLDFDWVPGIGRIPEDHLGGLHEVQGEVGDVVGRVGGLVGRPLLYHVLGNSAQRSKSNSWICKIFFPTPLRFVACTSAL